MYTKQLDTFLQVADLGSFSKAAQALDVTPSAVVQQVRGFENDLRATLFIRTSQGVRLTEAGRLVYQEGKLLMKRGQALRQNLEQLQSDANLNLHVGTCLLCKCRVFNQLWPQFSRLHPDYTLSMQDLEACVVNYDDVDLFENVYAHAFWDKNWQFFPLGRVPVVCAVSRRHPLAPKKRLRYSDLRDYSLVTVKDAAMVGELRALNETLALQKIHTIEVERYDLAVFNVCDLNQYVLQLPACWQDLYPEMVTIPCEWDYTVRYGFFYKDAPSPAVQEFLEFARRMLEAGRLPALNGLRPAAAVGAGAGR